MPQAGDESINKAAALRFDPETDRTPKLIARGTGSLAREMVSVAREHDRPVVRDPALGEVLSALPVGGEIPENLYRAVSGIFALIYQLERNEGGSPRT